ncbi:DUF3307 domain-containing protein [Aestuariibaculum sediminum]|uniref:DUF3307 domain-containing protein n=1 Tax=Aestuariibaculum sediminum TaxID=2770637 RepID=A0A8J6UCD2_9FLAO|nr:DUF3307 domain-containing protein [Aestuariibaculum sediminum]MBD0832289.1 DUF3307 domain-containing protein [Aestuariibaculum sediminum]
MMLLIKLLAAHLIGDFFIQPKRWVIEKERKKLKSPKLYIHVLIHILLTAVVLWEVKLWPVPLIIGVSHFIIDALKLYYQKKKTKRLFFFIDQFLHLSVIVVCYYFFSNSVIEITNQDTETLIFFILCLAFLTTPASIIMKNIFMKWNISKLTKNNASLKDAGKYIGILERCLVFVFIVFGHWEAVGFLITAKSVFRFGDLKESKHRKLTEYILIGTLISFSIAITTGIIFNLFINHV